MGEDMERHGKDMGTFLVSERHGNEDIGEDMGTFLVSAGVC